MISSDSRPGRALPVTSNCMSVRLRIIKSVAKRQSHSAYWGRVVSLAGLYRLLKVLARYLNDPRSGQPDLHQAQNIFPYCRHRPTLARLRLLDYHTNLLRLSAVHCQGNGWCSRADEPNVAEFLSSSLPKDKIEVILRDSQCRQSVFDAFIEIDRTKYICLIQPSENSATPTAIDLVLLRSSVYASRILQLEDPQYMFRGRKQLTRLG